MHSAVQEVKLSLAALERDVRVLQGGKTPAASRPSNGSVQAAQATAVQPAPKAVESAAKTAAPTQSRKASKSGSNRGKTWFGTLRRRGSSKGGDFSLEGETKIARRYQRATNEFIEVNQGDELEVLGDRFGKGHLTVSRVAEGVPALQLPALNML